MVKHDSKSSKSVARRGINTRRSNAVDVPLARPGEFFVTATRAIGANIQMGDHILIDPKAEPKPGQYVLVADNLELWSGQPERRGVAVQLSREFPMPAEFLQREARRG